MLLYTENNVPAFLKEAILAIGDNPLLFGALKHGCPFPAGSIIEIPKDARIEFVGNPVSCLPVSGPCSGCGAPGVGKCKYCGTERF